MTPNAFAAVEANYECRKLLGESPTRFWPFGATPQNPVKPYATWQVIYGTPENYVDCAPDIDSIGIQVDVWGDTISSVREVAEAIRRAVEGSAHVVALNGETREPDTKLYRVSFSVDFWQLRGNSNGS
jgi:hypothetical protein